MSAVRSTVRSGPPGAEHWADGLCSVALAGAVGVGTCRRPDTVTISWEPAPEDGRESPDGQPAVAVGRTSAHIVSVSPLASRGQFEVETTDHQELRFAAMTAEERDERVVAITMMLTRTFQETGEDEPKTTPIAQPTAGPVVSKRRKKGGGGPFACCTAPRNQEADLINIKSQAKPSERVTELLTHADNGADPNIRGRGNKLPVICIPGFCSSGLEVKKSDVMPSWIDTRVWFSLQKLGRARTQSSHAGAGGAAQTLSLTVH